MWHGIDGHDDVVERFRRSLQCGRLASTFLFVGPEGVGKRTFALKLAEALLCTESDDAVLAPCGGCESCRLFDTGSHPDLDVIGLPAGKRSLPIDLFLGDRDHRNQEGLCHNIALRPRLGRRRAAIIDDADWFTPESANCLLKTLEEPPPGALLILVGTSRSRQLPTILSRAQIVRFGALPTDMMAELLLGQGVATDAAQAEALAAASGGSFSRAEELADADVWQLRLRLGSQLTAAGMNVPRLAADLSEVINSAGKEAELRRRRFRQILALAIAAYRNLLRSPPPAMSVDDALAALDRCLSAEEQLGRNANQATLLESWLHDLAEITTPAAA